MRNLYKGLHYHTGTESAACSTNARIMGPIRLQAFSLGSPNFLPLSGSFWAK